MASTSTDSMLCSGISVMSLFVPFFLSKTTRLPVSTAMPSYCLIRSQRLALARNTLPGPQTQPTKDSMLSSSSSTSESISCSPPCSLGPQTGCKSRQRASIMLRLFCMAIALPP